jgi:hypothetical protein
VTRDTSAGPEHVQAVLVGHEAIACDREVGGVARLDVPALDHLVVRLDDPGHVGAGEVAHLGHVPWTSLAHVTAKDLVLLSELIEAGRVRQQVMHRHRSRGFDPFTVLEHLDVREFRQELADGIVELKAALFV